MNTAWHDNDPAACARLSLELAELMRAHEFTLEENAQLNYRLRKAEEARVITLSQLAHESKRPLTTIRLILDAMRHRCADCRADIDRMDSEVTKSTQYLDKLIMLGQLGVGQVSAPSRVNLSQMAAQIFLHACQYERARSTHAAISPDIVVDTAVEYPQSILENLVENAVRYTPSGGHIRISLVQRDAAIQLRVANSSTLQTRDIARLRQAFRRGEHDSRGSGLGLSIVAESAKAMRGSFQLRVRSGMLIAVVIIPVS